MSGTLKLNVLSFPTSNVVISGNTTSSKLDVSGNLYMPNYTISSNIIAYSIVGNITSPSFTSNSFVYTNTSGQLTTAVATDGQLLIGRTNNVPQVASLTAGTGITITPGAGSISIAASSSSTVSSLIGTVNQITVSPTTGNVTVSLSSNVTITSNLTVSGLSTNRMIYSGTGGLLTAAPAATNGQILVGLTGGAPHLANIVGGNNMVVTTDSGTILLSSNTVTSITGTTDYISATPTTGSVVVDIPIYVTFPDGICMNVVRMGEKVIIHNGQYGVTVPQLTVFPATISYPGYQEPANTVWEYQISTLGLGDGAFFADWYVFWRRSVISSCGWQRFRYSFTITGGGGTVTQSLFENNYSRVNLGLTFYPTKTDNSPSTGYIKWTAGDNTYEIVVKIVGVFTRA